MNERLLRDFPFDRVELYVLVAPSESTTSASSAPFVLRLRPEIAPPRPPPAPAVKFFLAHDFALAAARARCDRFNRVRFALEMTRQWQWFMWRIVAVVALLQGTSWMVGEFEVDAFGERTNWLLTIFLAQSAFLYIVGDAMPRVSYLTTLDKFLILSTYALFASMVESWLALRLARRDRARADRLDALYHSAQPVLYVLASAALWLPPIARMREHAARGKSSA